MNSYLAYLGSGKTKIELKFLQEITKSFSNPLLHTSTFEFITYFLLTQKKKNRLFYIHWCALARRGGGMYKHGPPKILKFFKIYIQLF